MCPFVKQNTYQSLETVMKTYTMYNFEAPRIFFFLRFVLTSLTAFYGLAIYNFNHASSSFELLVIQKIANTRKQKKWQILLVIPSYKHFCAGDGDCE